jgi:hypothetical protein
MWTQLHIHSRLTLTTVSTLRTGLDSANPYNPVPDKRMPEKGKILSESTSSAVGSRRSRAAAFGDNAPDDIFASAGRRPGRVALEAEGVSTSSSATTVGDEGEWKSHDSHFVMQCLLRGAECSNTMPASHALTFPSRVLRSGADGRSRPCERFLSGFERF